MSSLMKTLVGRFSSIRRSETLKLFLKHGRGTAGLVLLSIIVFMALTAEFIAPTRYDEVDPSSRLQPPSLNHLFGTDHLGRDVFSRVVYGARIALWVGFLVVVIEAGIGVTLGLMAGYYGGPTDKLISAVADMMWAFPPIILALAIVAILGPGLTNVVVAVSVVSWAPYTRVVRAKTQSIVGREFVTAARAIGETDLSIMFRYVLPNTLMSVIVLATLTIPSAILYTTALSFLGFGAQPPTPDWGAMLNEGKDYIFKAPWNSIFPGLFITLTALSFNLLGDALRDVLDPKLRLG
ncbi:MAG: ABC transporter permease [Zestosphaera sp.]